MTPAQRSISSLEHPYRNPTMFPSDSEDARMGTGAQVIGHPAATAVSFGSFRVFPLQRLLTDAEKPIQIGSRAFDILVMLLERPGELVSKEALIARVWPRTFVGQANLAVQIGALRRVLGDGRGGNRYILNTPGRGYRFVAPVRIEIGGVHGTAATGPLDGKEPPAMYEAPVPAPIATADRNDTRQQQPPQRRVLTVLRSAGAGEARAALALVEKLLASHGESFWVVGVAPIEES